jgi:hypothetical protein
VSQHCVIQAALCGRRKAAFLRNIVGGRIFERNL